MDNSYFLYPKNEDSYEIERFHNCTWEFENNDSLIEFGLEIHRDSLIDRDRIEISFYVPWFNEKCSLRDLYSQLRNAENSKFIFNDSVTNTISLDGGNNRLGVIHVFKERDKSCILPVELSRSSSTINILINLSHYNMYADEKPNIYIRFGVLPKLTSISTRKTGIAKSTIIYDIKINERRNIPDCLIDELNNKNLCKIKQCFNFNILPNRYDIVFLENKSLKNLRNLEHNLFTNYIGGLIKIPKDELIVVFNKKGDLHNATESFSFFSIFSKERIGVPQFTLAILLNVFCGLLFFTGAFRSAPQPNSTFLGVVFHFPNEIYIAFLIVLITLGYFLWPYLVRLPERIRTLW